MNKFYIRQCGAYPGNWYWMQNAQNWTSSPFDATLFDNEFQALDELEAARLTSMAEVLEQMKPLGAA